MLMPGNAAWCAYVRACVRSPSALPQKTGLLPNVTITPRRNFYNRARLLTPADTKGGD